MAVAGKVLDGVRLNRIDQENIRNLAEVIDNVTTFFLKIAAGITQTSVSSYWPQKRAAASDLIFAMYDLKMQHPRIDREWVIDGQEMIREMLFSSRNLPGVNDGHVPSEKLFAKTWPQDWANISERVQLAKEAILTLALVRMNGCQQPQDDYDLREALLSIFTDIRGVTNPDKIFELAKTLSFYTGEALQERGYDYELYKTAVGQALPDNQRQ